MIEMGVLFGLIGLAVLAGRLVFQTQAPKEQDPLNPYQIEMLDTARDITAVSRVLDWRMGL